MAKAYVPTPVPWAGPGGIESSRWPGAPEPVLDDEGRVTNAVGYCSSCSTASTLSYRCSECGYDLAGDDTHGGRP